MVLSPSHPSSQEACFAGFSSAKATQFWTCIHHLSRFIFWLINEIIYGDNTTRLVCDGNAAPKSPGSCGPLEGSTSAQRTSCLERKVSWVQLIHLQGL